jgi:hypothetical protein
MPDGGYFSQIGATLSRPSQSMTWSQLAASTVFVLIVLIAWRQVTLMLLREL